MGGGRPLKPGALTALVVDLADKFTMTGRKVTVAQRRLIMNRLRATQAEDPFIHSRRSQIAVVIHAFSDFTGIPPDVVSNHVAHL